MSSTALTIWHGIRADRLNEWFRIHSVETGSAGGSSMASECLEQGMVVRLASEFQGFCKDLHVETARHLAAIIPTQTSWLQQVFVLATITGRKLDQGNASSGILGHDFSVFRLRLWPVLEQQNPTAKKIWTEALDTLLLARNGVAHDDLDQLLKAGQRGWPVSLANVRRWRTALDGLAVAMDHVVRDHLHANLGTRPW